MEYLYCFANTSLTLRLIEYLDSSELPLDFVSIIHHIDHWLVRVKMYCPLEPQQRGDFLAFLNELGVPAYPSVSIRLALRDLEVGIRPMQVMRQHQVAVVCHGFPECEEIEAFRHQFINGLGYCPQHLA